MATGEQTADVSPDTISDHVLVLDGITKEYEDLTAVDDFSMAIEEGEFVCLLGPSGSGKTTTLNIIAGLEFPTAGDVYLGGDEVTNLPAQERDVGLVFQNLAIFNRMTVRENIEFGPKVEGVGKEARQELVNDIAESVGLTGKLDRKAGNLNQNEKQRVALARSIAAEPRILLLDEPVANLDAEEALDMRGELKTLQEELGRTMIYVTHDQEEAMSLADRIMVLHQGRLQQVGDPEELYSRPKNRFVAGFIGSPSMNFFDATVSEDEVTLLDTRIPTRVLNEAFEGFDAVTPEHDLEFGLRPEAIIYEPADADLEFSAELIEMEPLGPKTVVYGQVEGFEVTLVTTQRIHIQPGEEFTFGAAVADLYPIDRATSEVIY